MRSFASYACLFLTASVLNAQTPFCPEETFVPWEGMPIHCNDLVEYEGSIYGLDAYFTRTLWRYDPATGQTTALSGPPVALWGISLAQAGGKLYTFAGYPGSGISAQAHVYDIATNTWSSLPNLPFGLVTTSSAVVGDDIFITGSTHDVTVRYFLRYNITSNSYTVLTPPDNEAGCRLVAFNGLVYSVGGERYAPPHVTMGHFRVYDPSNGTWQELPNMPFERAMVAACIWGGSLHVFGGSTKSGDGWPASLSHHSEHFAYDFAAGQWQVAAAPMPLLPKEGVAIAVGDTAYVISHIGFEGASFKYYCGESGSPCVSSVPVSFTGLNTSYQTTDAASGLVGVPEGGLFFGPGMSGSSFDPAAAGPGAHTIVYTYIDGDGCVSSTGQCTAVSVGMGINDHSDMHLGGMRVYPNPTEGAFTLELELEGLVSLTVHDSRGRQVLNQTFMAQGAKTTRLIDLSQEAAGAYILWVGTKKGSANQHLIKR